MEILNNIRRIADIKVNNCNSEDLERYELIKEILKEDDCFFKIERTTAYSILEDLDILDDDIPNLYNRLTSQDMYLEINKKFILEDE